MDNREYNERKVALADWAEISTRVKPILCVCMIACGLYSLYSTRFERKLYTKNTAYVMATAAVGVGLFGLRKEYLKYQSEIINQEN